MNILPHKSWHVRTKKNIARVRKDEAEAAEKEKEVQRRIQLAAQESRTTFLRDRAKERVLNSAVKDEEESAVGAFSSAAIKNETVGNAHINFFQEIEDGLKLSSQLNPEHEAEKKKEKEEYEKKIGLLVYLGQNSVEETKDKPWTKTIKNKSFEVPQDQLDKMKKLKDFEDPLKDIHKSLKKKSDKSTIKFVKSIVTTAISSTSSSDKKALKNFKKDVKKKKKKEKKSKKHKKSKKRKRETSSSSESEEEEDSEDEKKRIKLEKLRNERLSREREERRRAEKLLASIRGEVTAEKIESTNVSNAKDGEIMERRQKYNSQFNPHLARQNYDN